MLWFKIYGAGSFLLLTQSFIFYIVLAKAESGHCLGITKNRTTSIIIRSNTTGPKVTPTINPGLATTSGVKFSFNV